MKTINFPTRTTRQLFIRIKRDEHDEDRMKAWENAVRKKKLAWWRFTYRSGELDKGLRIQGVDIHGNS